MSTNSGWLIRDSQPVRLEWGGLHNAIPHICLTCQIPLLTGETPGFCCGPNRRRFHDVRPLPELPPEYDIFLHDE